MNNDKRKTSFRVTKSLQDLEQALLIKMDIPQSSFHRRAIDYFLSLGEEQKINDRLLITQRSHLDYVEKNELEQIYISEKHSIEIEKLANKFNCKKSIILFQALLDYSVEMAQIYLNEKS